MQDALEACDTITKEMSINYTVISANLPSQTVKAETTECQIVEMKSVEVREFALV